MKYILLIGLLFLSSCSSFEKAHDSLVRGIVRDESKNIFKEIAKESQIEAFKEYSKKTISVIESREQKQNNGTFTGYVLADALLGLGTIVGGFFGIPMSRRKRFFKRILKR